MLEEAKKAYEMAGIEAEFEKLPAQKMAQQIDQQDLVLFHAVIEWLAEPLETLKAVSGRVKPGGHLSLLFFNYHSFVYRNALRGGWCIPFVGDESEWYGKGKKLTPPYPQKPEESKLDSGLIGMRCSERKQKDRTICFPRTVNRNTPHFNFHIGLALSIWNFG